MSVNTLSANLRWGVKNPTIIVIAAIATLAVAIVGFFGTTAYAATTIGDSGTYTLYGPSGCSAAGKTSVRLTGEALVSASKVTVTLDANDARIWDGNVVPTEDTRFDSGNLSVALPVGDVTFKITIGGASDTVVRSNSCGVTPSPSTSPSASVSPSTSPSASVSPSTSPSASVSPSTSPSASVSPSPSTSKSPSTSPSASVSPSTSPSASVSPSPSDSKSPEAAEIGKKSVATHTVAHTGAGDDRRVKAEWLALAGVLLIVLLFGTRRRAGGNH